MLLYPWKLKEASLSVSMKAAGSKPHLPISLHVSHYVI